jgi:hypothetical protein
MHSIIRAMPCFMLGLTLVGCGPADPAQQRKKGTEAQSNLPQVTVEVRGMT